MKPSLPTVAYITTVRLNVINILIKPKYTIVFVTKTTKK